MSQTEMFGTVELAPKYTRKQALGHKSFGNRCPACGAKPGQDCKPKRKGIAAFSTVHGMRTRYDRPGEYVLETDNEWGDTGRRLGFGEGS